jgi:predicted transcriptional regulator
MEILELAKTNIRKTKIMYKVSLSYAQLETYLTNLTNSELLTKNKDGSYKTTKKGENVIESCRTCRLLIKQLQANPTKQKRARYLMM